MPKDLTAWLTKQQAAEIIGVSTKTVEHLVATKVLQQEKRQNPRTGAHVAVLNPADVTREAKRRNPDAEAFIVPAPQPPPGPPVNRADRPQELQPQDPASELRALMKSTMLEVLGEVSPGHVKQPPPERQPVARREREAPIESRIYLTLREAADLSGLPQSLLKQAIEDKTLPARRTGAGWRIRRANLEKFEPNHS